MSCIIKVKNGRIQIEDADLDLVVYGVTPVLRIMNTRLEGFFIQKGHLPTVSLSPTLGWTFITLLLNRGTNPVHPYFLERQLWHIAPACGKTLNVYMNALRRLIKPMGLRIPAKGKGEHQGWELKNDQ